MTNLQTVAIKTADVGVRVDGMGSEMAGVLPASLSLPRQARLGYPTVRPDAELVADNAAAAQAVTRIGRSVRDAALARKASGTVLSKRSRASFSEHRECQAMRSTW
jgi:hypothetical protein